MVVCVDNTCYYVLRQVAYETELSGTPTAVFTEIQLIGQLLVLGIIVLIYSHQNIVVTLASQKSLCYGPQLFEIKILISSVFAYFEVFR